MNTKRVEKITIDRQHVVMEISGCVESDSGYDMDIEVRFPYEAPSAPNGKALGISISGQVDPERNMLRISIDRQIHGCDLLYRKLFVYENGCRLPGICFGLQSVDSAVWDYSYPVATTIKGLQVKVLEDALTLGLGHAALNVNLPCIVQATNNNQAISFRMEGKTFYFNRSYMEMLDGRIKALSERQIVVNLIILVRPEWQGVWGDPDLTPLLMHPSFHPDGIVSAFHVTTADALLLYRACLAFLAERYMRPDQQYGRACGWIIGNEVNAPWIYSNCGETDMSVFLSEYHIALRTAFYTARQYYAQARVYISLDHCWNMLLEPNDRRFYKGKAFLEALNENIRQEGNFDWNVAYHPFPEDLSKADFWNDKLAKRSFDTEKITFKNIEILPEFLKQEVFRYCGRSRRIILSEQGLCAGHTPETEQLQADAFVLAYKKIAEIPEIDSFIYHSHIDEHNEGLFLGLLADDGRERPIHRCFSRIDSKEGDELLCDAVRRIGAVHWRAITDWKENVPWN